MHYNIPCQMCTGNITDEDSRVVFWALNGYGVTVSDILINVVIVVLGTAVVVLNTLVLDTMIRYKKQQEPVDIMMCSLAFSDLLTGLLMYYQTLYNLINYQIYLECQIRHGLLFGLVVTSVLHLTSLTFDRYIKIIFPYRYNQLCQKATVAVLSAVLWTLSAIVAITPAIGWNLYETDYEGKLYTVLPHEQLPVCSFFGHLHPDYARFLVILFILFFLIMGLLYLHIFKVASRHARLIAAQETCQAPSRFRNRHTWRYTKTVLIILGLYFFCWLPVGIVLIMFVEGGLKDKTVVEQGTIILYASAAAYMNSFVNPIIYAFKLTVVRTRFLNIFQCRQVKEIDFESSVRERCRNGNCNSEKTYHVSTSENMYICELT